MQVISSMQELIADDPLQGCSSIMHGVQVHAVERLLRISSQKISRHASNSSHVMA